MPDKNGYPTEGELKELKELGSLENWKLDREYTTRFLDFIQDIWWAPDWGFKLTGKNVLRLELHTGGWSGNEEIISVLERTFFWTSYFAREDRGGHFYFKIPKEAKDG